MPFTSSRENEFLDRLTKIIEANLSNDQFGVSELASKIGMSRSNLHRKLKSLAGISISQFICKVRLDHAKVLLEGSSLTISEIAFDSGFHSVSYFIKCFHDQYGCPPGKVRKDEFNGLGPNDPQKDKSLRGTGKKLTSMIIMGTLTAVVIASAILLIILKPFGDGDKPLDKSIAVLPFRNDSPDAEKMYFINGTMEAILENLGSVEDLRVVSRNSVEQYRNNPKSTFEIAEEMNVSYLLEGSGLKDGGNIRLTIQLIDAKNDKHIWSRTYDRKTEEQFAIQSEIAQLVAAEIHAAITPEEKELIQSVPTTSLTAYDFYQQGNESLFNWWRGDGISALEEAEQMFYKALEYDSTFAKAYAKLASSYHLKYDLLEGGSKIEEVLDSCIKLADMALSNDDQCTEAYSEKGFCLMHLDKNDLACEVLKKGIKYNPNHWETYLNLGKVYSNLGKQDLALASLYQASNLHRGKMLPNLYIQIAGFYNNFGFEDKAIEYYQEWLKLTGDSGTYFHAIGNTANLYGDLEGAVRYHEKAFVTNSSNSWLIYSLAFDYMFLGQFEESLSYFKQLEEMWSGHLLNINLHRIGYVYWQLGFKEEANEYFDELIAVVNNKIISGEVIVLDYYNLAGVLAFRGNKEKALENFKISYRKGLETKNGKYWVTLMKNDPFLDNIRNEPEFLQIINEMEDRFEEGHEKVKKWMEENNLI